MRQNLLLLCLALTANGSAPPSGTQKIVYQISTVAGSGNLGDGGPATLAQIGTIQGLAVDRLGNVYLSDTNHHTVRKINTTGIITTLAGTGTPGFSGDGGPATAAQLRLPYGLAADLAGNVFVADLGNNRVRRIAPDGTISTFAGSGERGSAGDGGPAVSAQLMTPRNLTVDAAGNVYISEFEGHRVRKVSTDGKISTVAGIGLVGFRGDGGPATMAQLAYPAGLALDRSGALYIADSQNQRVRKILPDGVIGTVLGGSPGTKLFTPLALAVDTSGTIYVADHSGGSSGLVQAYTTAGSWTQVALGNILDLALDLSGSLYIADNVYIRKIGANGMSVMIAGDAYAHVGDGGNATAAQLLSPSAVSLDFAGNLYIADTGTQRIRRVSSNGQISTVAGTGVAGYNGDGGSAGSAQLNGPAGVTVDWSGNVIVADTYNQRVRLIDPGGRISTVVGTGLSGLGQEGSTGPQTPVNGPRAVCSSRSGTLYIVDTGNHRVLSAAPGSSIVTAAGNGSPGNAGDGGPARFAQLNLPAACALDTAGNLFVADSGNNVIRKITLDGAISTIVGAGKSGFGGDGGPATAALLSQPGGVAVDDNGDIFIADTGNNRIRWVTPDGAIQTIAGDDTKAALVAPAGLVLDGSGNLYVADTGNNLVRKLSPTTVTVAPAPVTAPPITVENIASLAAGPLAPGEVIAIFGQGLGPEAGVAGTPDGSGPIANLVAGTEVRFDGVPAPVLYAQAAQVNAQVPYTVAGSSSTNVEVRYNGTPVGSLTLAVADAAPGLSPIVTNQDGSPNSKDNPAPRNTIVTLYGTGEGLTDGPNVAGLPASDPLPKPKLPVGITVSGVPAEILYAGSAPTLVGMLQINVRIPGGFLPPGQASLQLTIGKYAAPPITIWLQ